ncbi:radixin isoform X2 [Prionailurus iriomotensis]
MVGTQTVCTVPDAFLSKQYKADVTGRRLPPSLGPWHLTHGEL